MGFRKFAVAALAVVGIGYQPLCAQATQPGEGSGAASSPGVMRLNVVVSGGSADGLQKSEVKLLDNGSPTTVQSLDPGGAAGDPVRVVLILDDVNARLTTIAYERDELKKFFTRNEGQLSVPFAIGVMTDTRLDIQQGFSQNGIAENAALQKYSIGLHEITRDSQYGGWDRTTIGVRSLEQLVQSLGAIPGRKLVVFVSPGWPLFAGPRVDLTADQQREIYQSVARLQNSMLRAGVTLDMVNPFGPGESLLRANDYQGFLKGVSKQGDADVADLSLQVLAVHSGGTVQQGSNDIAAMMERSLADVRNSYTLAFVPKPGETPNEYHSLKLEVNRPGVRVRLPDEYYAPVGTAAAGSR